MRRSALILVALAFGLAWATPAAAVYNPGEPAPVLLPMGDPGIYNACRGVSACLSVVNECWHDGGTHVEITSGPDGHGRVSCYG